ncbi:MAG: 50S ribosomal protein L18 [Patescibacteria group bacterium]
MNKAKLSQVKKHRRVARTRARISGTALRPRLAVFRSNYYTAVQLIDDEARKTLATASSKEFSGAEAKKKKAEQALAVGKKIAEKALALGVKQVVFDRRSYQYHGRVKAVADGAREAGLTI